MKPFLAVMAAIAMLMVVDVPQAEAQLLGNRSVVRTRSVVRAPRAQRQQVVVQNVHPVAVQKVQVAAVPVFKQQVAVRSFHVPAVQSVRVNVNPYFVPSQAFAIRQQAFVIPQHQVFFQQRSHCGF